MPFIGRANRAQNPTKRNSVGRSHMQVREQGELMVHVATEAEAALVASLVETKVKDTPSVYVQRKDEGETVRLLADDPEALQHTLETAGFKCQTNAVIVIRSHNWMGLAARLGALLRQMGTNILYS